MIKVDEGTTWYASELIAGNAYYGNGTQLNFSLRPNSTNSYIASIPYNDGTGRFRDIWYDRKYPDMPDELVTIHVTSR